MFKHLKAKWDSNVGPKDERLVAEENRLYAKMAKALLGIGILSMFYGNALRRAAGMFDDAALGSKYYTTFPPEMIVGIGIIICCALHTSSLTKQGIITTESRFAEVDACPTGFFAIYAALASVLVFASAFVLESFAQMQFDGLNGVYWMSNLALALFMAGIVFVGSLAALVLYYHDAKKNRKRIEAELED